MKYHTPVTLGPHQSMTPEGFLLCKETAIARTGYQDYLPEELGIADASSVVQVRRPESEVFRDETMASFEGKPVTLDHPSEMVTPDNWSAYAKGTVQNVHRGEGNQSDLLIADLLITDKKAIEAVRQGLRQVSCGYDAQFKSLGQGLGEYSQIVGNHLALVPLGRCGSRCSIGDKAVSTEKTELREKAFLSRMFDSMAKIFKDDVETLEEGKDNMNDEESLVYTLKKVSDSLSGIDKRLSRLEKGNDEANTETKTATKDSKKESELKAVSPAITNDDAKRLISRLEILNPGMRVPTFDSLNETARDGAICQCQRQALDQAYQTQAGKEAIEPFLDGHAAHFDELPVAKLQAVFDGAAELMRVKNNTALMSASYTDQANTARNTIAQINEANRKAWAKPSS